MRKLLAGLLCIPCVAHAEFWTGNMLLQRINSSEAYERGTALGYILGVSDTGQNATHCSGSQVTAGQTRDVVKQYLEQNPAIRDFSADFLATVALGQAFPCPKDKKKSGSKS